MKIYKACKNTSCDNMDKRIKVNFSDKFCMKCGQPLFHVCYDCKKIIEENSEKFCSDCIAKHEQAKLDRTEKAKAVVAIAPAAVGVMKSAVDTIPKIMKNLPKK